MMKKKLRIAVPVHPELSTENYLDALKNLGAEGVVCEAVCPADGFDGLLLPGGCDADPTLYGECNLACEHVNRALDDLQLGMLDMFVKAKKPVLGICRGHQLINVYFGGTLIQHLPCSDCHSRMAQPADKVHTTHAVPGSVMERMYGCCFCTNSSHHQAIGQLGDGLEIVEWSDDGVAEAVKHETLPVFGVQWHPERMCFAHARHDTVDGSKVIAYFLEKCGEVRENGGIA